VVDADDAGNGGVVVAGSGATGDADSETDDPLKAEIMRATYRALIEQGYSELTIQGIADEFLKSKSLLYYHYDGKDDLIASFLGFATDRFRREIEIEIDDPEAQLRALVDQLVPESLDDDEYRVQVALLELRSETPHNEQFRQQYAVVVDDPQVRHRRRAPARHRVGRVRHRRESRHRSRDPRLASDRRSDPPALNVRAVLGRGDAGCVRRLPRSAPRRPRRSRPPIGA